MLKFGYWVKIMFAGLVGKKLGMSCIICDDGRRLAVTVLKVAQHEVLAHKTVEKHGYEAVIVGSVEVEEKKLKKPMQGVFKKLGSKFFKILKEFRPESGDILPEIGTIYSADRFIDGMFVDVTGTSIGKGYAGPMKRHNFHGLRASHGVSASHRSHGSTGNRTDPGKVFKGKKMAGHMGHERVTIQNLKIVGTRQDNQLLLVEGAIPGPKGGYVIVNSAIKKRKSS